MAEGKSRNGKSAMNGQLPDLNGLSIDDITISQDGDLTVTFDLPIEQATTKYELELQGSRTLDLYENEELQKVCRDLFRIVRKMMEVPDEERVQTHCDSCQSSSCCRKYNVLVTQFDVERLCKGLKLSEAELRRKHLADAVDWCEDYKYQLTCDEDDDGEEKCKFLKEQPNGQFRCSIYEHRPEICRSFDMNTCNDFVPLEEVETISN
jgi:Fe-S-cluster containining protein